MRLGSASRRERGDTLIEVIFAVAVFALVAVSSLAIMNQGVVTGERALEVTLVRQQIDAQAEALRYMHGVRLAAPDGVATDWTDLISRYGQTGASPYGVAGGTCTLPGGSYKPFILNARTAKVSPSPPTIEPAAGPGYPPYPQVIYDDLTIRKAYGLWVEAVPSDPGDKTRFVDFHIRACWAGPGSSVPMTLGTIVRLYDPN